MPSGPKKRRAAKKKNDSNASCPNQAEEKPVAAVELAESVTSNVLKAIASNLNPEAVHEMCPKENNENDCQSVCQITQNERNESESVRDQIILETITELMENSNRSLDDAVHSSKKNELKEHALVDETDINDQLAMVKPVEPVVKEDADVSQIAAVQDPLEEPLRCPFNEPPAMLDPVDPSVLKENIAKSTKKAQVTSVDSLGSVAQLGIIEPLLSVSKGNVEKSLKETKDSYQVPLESHIRDPLEIVKPVEPAVKDDADVSLMGVVQDPLEEPFGCPFNEPPAMFEPVVKEDADVSKMGVVQNPLGCPFNEPPAMFEPVDLAVLKEPLGCPFNEPPAMFEPVALSVLKENIAKSKKALVSSVDPPESADQLGIIEPLLSLSEGNVNKSLKEAKDSYQVPPESYIGDPLEIVNTVVPVLKDNVAITPADASSVERIDQNELVEVKTLLEKVLHHSTETSIKVDKLMHVTNEISLRLSQLSETLSSTKLT